MCVQKYSIHSQQGTEETGLRTSHVSVTALQTGEDTSKHHRWSNKKTNAWCWISAFELLVSGIQAYRPTVIALFCPLELDGKTLLLKISHTSVIGPGEIKVVLNWKCPPRGSLSSCQKMSCRLWREKSYPPFYLGVKLGNYNNELPS